jgi:predicted O-methyltransferase YrrM
MHGPGRLEWTGERTFRVDGANFVAGWPEAGAAPDWDWVGATEALGILKSPSHVRSFVDLLTEVAPRNIMEVGIAHGGSAALMAQVAKPDRLVAVDLAPTPVPNLEAFIERHGVADSVRPYYGVDQSDRERLQEIVAADFGEEPLDLVVDDASHIYDLTRATFEILFPRLRPDGEYVIEDWGWLEAIDHALVRVFQAPTPEERRQVEEHMLRALRDPESPVRDGLEQWLAAGGDDVWRADVERWFAEVPRTEPTRSPSGGAPAMPSAWFPVPDLGPSDRPLARFVLELVLMAGAHDQLISRITVENEWISVRRGPARLDADFRIDDVLPNTTALLLG